MGKCTPVEAIINSEQLSEPVEMSAKDQHEFSASMKNWVEGLAVPKRNEAKKLEPSPQKRKDKEEYAWSTRN